MHSPRPKNEDVQPDFFPNEERIPPISYPSSHVEGRDELNLAEFPLAALSNRVSEGQKTLEFRDTIYDRQSKRLVERRLTVTAADKFGLPNAIDDEIILGLIQLSKKQGFTSKTVPFSRYEIIKILGWDDQTWNYQRILKALDRWTGVTLKYENAWWDPERKAWANETFHILERLTEIKDCEGRERAAFVWSDVIFSNLQKGHLKILDLNIYRRLKNPVAKRLYRLLDKRFYHRRRVEFDLVELAFHKLGVAKTYLVNNIKQRLHPAIEELETAGIIKPIDRRHRYEKHGVGKWHVVFDKADSLSVADEGEEVEPLPVEAVPEVEKLLMAEGVTAKKARRLATTMPEDYLRAKMDEIRFLRSRSEKKMTNPAGYLVRAIEENYPAPQDFKSAVQQAQELKEKAEKRAAKRRQNETAEARAKEKALKEADAKALRANQVEDYLNSMPQEKREALIGKITQQEQKRGLFRKSPKLQELHIQQVIEDHVAGLISEK
ncbi:MAG: Replication initiator protein [Verrucomicrobiales bacterium]|nr:Replication initiator protein [Verrucomicrobiales bacterium]